MVASETFRAGAGPVGMVPAEAGGLLDVLSVAAVVLDAEGRITLWSPQAQELFGWPAEEALGRYAAELLVSDEYVGLVLELFAKVMAGGGAWAGVFPVRHKDGSTRLAEFRNMRLQDAGGGVYALGSPATKRSCGAWNGIWPCRCRWWPSPRSGWRCWTPA